MFVDLIQYFGLLNLFCTGRPIKLKNDPDHIPSIFVYSIKTSASSEKVSHCKWLIQHRERQYLSKCQAKNESTVEQKITTVTEHSHNEQEVLPAEKEHDKENNDPQVVSSAISEPSEGNSEFVPSLLTEESSEQLMLSVI